MPVQLAASSCMSEPENRIRSLVRPTVLEMEAYHVQPSSGLVKLDAMENPYPLPDALRQSWLEAIGRCDLNRYPDASATALAATVRRINGVPESCGLFFGNGSDELIQIILTAVAVPGATVLAPEPGFVMYSQVARSLGLEFVGVPLLPESFALDRQAMLDTLKQRRPSVVFLAYPNNPTGNLFAEDDMLSILEAAPGLVVIDEAYAPFAEATFMDRVGEYPHLLLMRTISKLGLAGLRLGYLVGHPLWVEQFNKVRLPYNINTLTQLTAELALSSYSVFDEQSRKIRKDRQRLFESLAGMGGVSPFESRANFILFRVDGKPATRVFEDLKKAGVLIKSMGDAEGPLKGCLRVTVGKAAENEKFFRELSRIVSG